MRTTREKNADRLLRQGRRWDKQRMMLEEQEKRRALAAQEEREALWAKRTISVFDGKEAGKNVLMIHDDRFDDCERDLEQFLHDEQERMRNRGVKKMKRKISKDLKTER